MLSAISCSFQPTLQAANQHLKPQRIDRLSTFDSAALALQFSGELEDLLAKSTDIGIEFVGPTPDSAYLKKLLAEFDRIPKPVLDLFKLKKTKFVLLNNGLGLYKSQRDADGEMGIRKYLQNDLKIPPEKYSSPDTAQWIPFLNLAIAIVGWPPHDIAPSDPKAWTGSGSVVTHEWGHGFDTLMTDPLTNKRPSTTKEFRDLIDKLADEQKWEWAHYTKNEEWKVFTATGQFNSQKEKRAYNEIFARGFDDYTDRAHPKRRPMPAELVAYFDKLVKEAERTVKVHQVKEQMAQTFKVSPAQSAKANDLTDKVAGGINRASETADEVKETVTEKAGQIKDKAKKLWDKIKPGK
jgi:hypothetical protein